MMSSTTEITATLISPNGEVDTVPLPAGNQARIQFLQSLVGGYIEAVPLPGGRYLVINEDGKNAPHTINETATAIAHEAESIMRSDYIAGPAVIVPQEALA